MAAEHNFIHLCKMRLVLISMIKEKVLKKWGTLKWERWYDYKVRVSQNDFTHFGEGKTKEAEVMPQHRGLAM
jgi:hypothetical protein